MHQKVALPAYDGAEPIGGGIADQNEYTTWELKECPVCKRLCVEHYSAIVVTSVEEARMVASSLSIAITNL